MTTICGKSGKKNGINCCYVLIDHFFNREFLTKFSWSGGSRNNETKECFKVYKNIIKTFYIIVAKAALDFSELDCENFFKNIIKNAKRRCLLATIETKRRTSSSKNRPKNLIYKSVGTQQQEADVEGELCEKQ